MDGLDEHFRRRGFLLYVQLRLKEAHWWTGDNLPWPRISFVNIEIVTTKSQSGWGNPRCLTWHIQKPMCYFFYGIGSSWYSQQAKEKWRSRRTTDSHGIRRNPFTNIIGCFWGIKVKPLNRFFMRYLSKFFQEATRRICMYVLTDREGLKCPKRPYCKTIE